MIGCRRRPLRALFESVPGVFALCLALIAPPAARAADDWGQEGQDSGAGSLNREQTALGPDNLDRIVKLWSRDLDIWQQSTDVAVADGQVFVGRKVADEKKTVQQQLLRLDLETGETVWQVNLQESFTSPLLTPTLVIVAGNQLGAPTYPTRVQGFDRTTGEKRWQYLHPKGSNAFLAPHLLDGVLYLVTLDGDTVALDAETGALRWRRLHDANCCSTNGLAVADGVVVVGRSKGLLALDAADGHTLWRHDLPDFRIASVRPMIVGSTALLFGLDGRLHAYDLASGSRRWAVQTPSGKTSRSLGPMATDGQRIFVLNGVVAPRLGAIDLTTGATLWSAHQPAWTHSPTVSNGVLYLVTDKHLLALDPATGAALPIARLPTTSGGDLAIASGHLLLSRGPVRAFALQAEAPLSPGLR